MDLAELRMNAGLTQVELSRRSGVPAETISRVENGRRRARMTTRRALLRVLKVPVDLNIEVFGPWPQPGPKPKGR